MSSAQQLDIGERRVPSSDITTLVHRARADLRDHNMVVAMFGQFAQDCYQSPYSEQWLLHTEGYTTEQLRTTFAPLVGKVVVDLGCGVSSSFRELISPIGVAGYIGVDHIAPNFDGQEYFLDDTFGPVVRAGLEGDEFVDGWLVESDMLDFVSRLPDEFGSFVVNGIDGFILEPHTAYARALAKEVKRATAVGGGVVGAVLGSSVLDYLLEDDAFDTVDHCTYSESMHYYVHTKVRS